MLQLHDILHVKFSVPISWSTVLPYKLVVSLEKFATMYNQKVHYHVHKSPKLVPIQSLMNLVHTLATHLLNSL
jgi:hypothetical protein